ncbi:uncharacterized protein G2W53_019640 [Senna tora]|uniref:Uncharacterized protein n=1 Tax=Senna tora TaxID=362788 RepID=A0A834TY57_9FABA|nr:uncharacterized protein G2W53_019640 [Senna tora]
MAFISHIRPGSDSDGLENVNANPSQMNTFLKILYFTPIDKFIDVIIGFELEYICIQIKATIEESEGIIKAKAGKKIR